MSLGEIVLNKVTSGRFLVFIMVTGTLCYAVIQSINAVFGIIKVDPAIKDLVEKVAMFILGAFVSLVTGIYKEYFDRSDRTKQENGKGEVK